MAIQVAGELYYDLDGQLLELKRQLRQPAGYPFDPNLLKVALQNAIEGKFVLPASTEPAPVPVLDTIIRVNRSVRPAYPDWMERVVHPELETTGPAEYDLPTVVPWLHDGQKDGGQMVGTNIYDYLKRTDELKLCLGLADALAIQKKGIKVFRKFYRGKVVFFWRSVVLYRDGSLHVPYLIGIGDGVKLYWRWLGSDWFSYYPALRLAS